MAYTQRPPRLRIPGCRPGEEPTELVHPADAVGLSWRRVPVEEQDFKVASWTARMEACAAWAEIHGVRLGPGSDDPAWLLKATARRDRGPRPDWADHPLCWVRGRQPAAFTATVYSYDHVAPEIHRWLADKPGIGLAVGPGWYRSGQGTEQIVLWRRDVLGHQVAVADAGAEALSWA
ncbi:hypothetical protein ABZ905_32030 [Streptomyces parvus]|uniref:hypothetical protein n=1 Tax=Streptomyces parvus TaxID=66428 RepID=UPI0033EE639F